MRRTKLKVRILSWVLSFLMAFTAVPTYAAETVSGNEIAIENHAPELSADAPEMVELTVGDSYDVTQYFSDEDGDTLTYTVDCDDIVLGTKLSAYEYVPTEAGRFLVSVEASDGQESTWWAVAMIVTEEEDGFFDEKEDEYFLDAFDEDATGYSADTGIDIVTGDVASAVQDIRISNIHIGVSGEVESNTASTDGKITVQLTEDVDELEITLSLFGKKGLALRKAMVAVNNEEATAPESIDEDNNVATYTTKVTPGWNEGEFVVTFTTGYDSSSGLKNSKDYIITFKKTADTPGTESVESVSVSPETAEVEVGKTVELTAEITPANATNKKVIWSSSDTDTATVENGIVTGVKEGTATITATTEDGAKTDTCTVTVKTAVDTGIATGNVIDIADNKYYDRNNQGKYTATAENITVSEDVKVTYANENGTDVFVTLDKETDLSASFAATFAVSVSKTQVTYTQDITECTLSNGYAIMDVTLTGALSSNSNSVGYTIYFGVDGVTPPVPVRKQETLTLDNTEDVATTLDLSEYFIGAKDYYLVQDGLNTRLSSKIYNLNNAQPGTFTYVFAAGYDDSVCADHLTVTANVTHVCVFDHQNTDEKYLASAATCTTVAEYYYSCEYCGKKGTETFEYGSAGHSFAEGSCTVCGIAENAPQQDAEGYYKLGNEGELIWFANLVNGTLVDVEKNASAKAILTEDITLTRGWTPIGSGSTQWAGTFEGQGHTVSGMTITSGGTYRGFFGQVKEGTIKNLTVEGNITGANYAYLGGIAGRINAGSIQNCISRVDMQGSASFTGGIAGEVGANGNNELHISGCGYEGTISTTGTDSFNNYAGGIAGVLYGKASYSQESYLQNCYNNGSITAVQGAGGIVGYYSGGSISNCYNAGNLIQNNSGEKNTNAYAGGIAGWIKTDNTLLSITNVYTTGTISGNGEVGNIAAGVAASATNCYYLSGVLAEDEGNGIAKTAEEMKSEAFVSALGSAFKANCKDKYPVLTWQAETHDFGSDGICTECGATSRDHTCSFTQKVEGEKYLAHQVDCETAQTYYYSCSCGEPGTDTFTVGEALGHKFEDGSCSVCGDIDPGIAKGNVIDITDNTFLDLYPVWAKATDITISDNVTVITAKENGTTIDVVLAADTDAFETITAVIGYDYYAVMCSQDTVPYTLDFGTGEMVAEMKGIYSGTTKYATYTINFTLAEDESDNNAPALAQGKAATASAEIVAGETYTLNASDYFTDADNDELTYYVKFDGKPYAKIESGAYSYTGIDAGTHTLVFKAYDGKSISGATHTVTLTVKNDSRTYAVPVVLPEDVDVIFYAATVSENGELIKGVKLTCENNTLKVPMNVSRVMWEADGYHYMSAAVEADKTLTIAYVSFDANTYDEKDDDNAAILITDQDNFSISGKASDKYLLADAQTCTYEITPTDTENYNPVIMSDITPATGVVSVVLPYQGFTITVPEGSTLNVGEMWSYFKYNFDIKPYITKTNADGTVTYTFRMIDRYGSSFLRVQHPDGVTYWDYRTFENNDEIVITAEDIFLNSDSFKKNTILHNFEELPTDVADIYLSVNRQMYVDLDVGEDYKINVIRNWQAIEGMMNNKTALPDVHYTVIDANGNKSNVVTVTPDEFNSSEATIKANSAGTAIVLVTYDAMYSTAVCNDAMGYSGKAAKVSAIWPENTGVFVVSVGADGSSIVTNMDTDPEHDPIYYVGDEGAEFSFTPESGCKVSVARAKVGANSLTYKGFTTDKIEMNSKTGEVTVSGLTQGRHIIRVEKNGVATYQVVTTKKTSYTITDSDGNTITEETLVTPGTELTIQFTETLYNPVNKLAGIYNSNCAVLYTGQDGTVFEGSNGGSPYGYYIFAANTSLHKVTVTIPETWAQDTYTLSGSFKIAGFGGNGGGHRGILLYETGKNQNNNADNVEGNPGVLPTITIAVDPSQAKDPIPATKVELNKTSVELKVGMSTTLKETVSPADTTDKVVAWTSSNEAVATVKDGIVVAVAEGTAVVTVKVGNCTAECNVTVVAEEEDEEEDTDSVASVYFSISHDDTFLECSNTGKVMALQKLDVPYFDLKVYDLEKYSIPQNSEDYGKVTALHLYIYAMETCYYGVEPEEAGKGYLKEKSILGTDMLTISGDAGSIFLEKFWGMSMNLNYYKNYQYPTYTGTSMGATADQIILNDGDIITVGHFTSYAFYSDPTSIFNFIKAGENTVETSGVKDSEIVFSVWRAGSNMGTTIGTANEPVEKELDVYYAKADSIPSGNVTEWVKLGTTNAKGEITVNTSSLEAGQYIFAVAGRKGSTYTTDICSAPGGIRLNVLKDEESVAVKDVISKINAIGEVTVEDAEAIQEARNAYEALTTVQKDAVTNYGQLKAAEEELAILLASEADKKAAAEVDKMIAEIGEVTLADEEAIKAARKAYNALTDAQKRLVNNLDKLETAEKEWEDLQIPEPVDADVEKIYKETGDYMEGLGVPDVGTVGGEWMALGLARSGREVPSGYYDNIVAYVKENINDNSQLHKAKSTDNSRLILALTASGYDPRDVKDYNLLEGLTDLDYVKKQGINGPIWALIALDSYNYAIPMTNAKNPVTRTTLVNTILTAQLADGGWALSGVNADADMTGMALTALAPYYKINKKVKVAVDKALVTLSQIQHKDGSYGSVDGSNSESCAQVIVALTALGINPDTDSRFMKNNISVVDALCGFAVEGGGFKHISILERDGMATEQGYYALTAYMRFLDGETSLYDMSDVTIKVGSESGNGESAQTKQDEAAAKTVEDLIDAIGTVTVNSESKIKAARAAYDKLTAAQKKLVDNYGKLTAAEATFDVKKADYVEDLIDAIGTVTVNSASRIAKARVAYYNLTDAQKKLVDNYEYLLYAEDKLEEARVEYVEDLIDSIGTVTKNSKTKIDRARTAYNNLSDSNKAKVSNLNVLLEAEAAYTKLAATSTTTKPTTKPSTKPATKVEETEDVTEDLSKFAEKVKEQIESIGKDSLAGEMLDAILAYEELTEEEKAAIDKEWFIENLKEGVAEELQTDSKTGIGVSGAEWNIQIVVDDVLDVTEIQYMQEKLGGNTMLGLWDIYLEDVLTGKEVQPDGSILVKIPLALLGDYVAYDGLTVVHYAEDGTVEYLNSTLIGDCIAFNATEFSYYAVAGYMGASPLDNLTDDVISDDVKTDSSAPVLPWVIGGGCGLALLAVLLFLIMKNKKVQAGD